MLFCRAAGFFKGHHRLMRRFSWVQACAGTTLLMPKVSFQIKIQDSSSSCLSFRVLLFGRRGKHVCLNSQWLMA